MAARKFTDQQRKEYAERMKARIARDGHHLQGKTRSAEVKAKVSRSLKKRFADPKERERLSRQQKDVWKDPEKRARMIENSNAAKRKPEFRAQMSRSQKERMKDPAVRARMRESGKKAWEDPARHAEYAERTKLQLEMDGHPMKGKKHSEESKKKMSEVHKNMSSETRRRISRSQKKRFEDPKEREKSRIRQTERMRDPRVRESALDGLRKARSAMKDTLPEKCVQYILGELLGVDYEIQYKADRGNGKYYAIDAFVEPNIAIEVDGAFWHSAPGFESGIRGGRSSSEVRVGNERRDQNLRELGYRVIHVSELDLKNDMSRIIKILAEVCDARLPVEADVYYADVARKAAEYEASLRKERWQKRSVATRDRRNARNRERWATNDRGYRDRQKAHARARRPQTNTYLRDKRANDPAWRDEQNKKAKARRDSATPERKAEIKTGRSEYYRQNREQIRTKQNANYASNEAFRERQKERSRLRSKTHKDEISRKNKERLRNETPEKRAARLAKGRKRHAEKKDEVNRKRRAQYRDPEYRARESAKQKEYRERDPAKTKRQRKESYDRQKARVDAAIIGHLGGHCFKCGAESNLLVGTNLDACRADGHKPLRNLARRHYAENPDEARKYLRLACPDCKDWRGGPKREYP